MRTQQEGGHQQAEEDVSGETKPADTLILEFQPSELWENIFLLFEPHSLWYILVSLAN